MAQRVLTPEERQLARNYRLAPTWVRSRDYNKKKDLYAGTLSALGGAITSRDADPDLALLTDLFALTFETDRSFRGFVEKKNRNSERLRQRSGWEEVYHLAAGLVVERFVREGGGFAQDSDSGALTREEIADRAQELVAKAKEIGAQADVLVGDGTDVDRYDPPDGQGPDLTEFVLRQLEGKLADEFVVVDAVGDGQAIPRDEREREISKRALMRLRLGELRTVAEQEGLPDDGTLERLADRLAAKFNDDAADIARLVLSHSDEIPERGFVTHLIPLVEPANADRAHELLARCANRYVRVGVAKWFVFSDVTTTGDGVRVSGTLHYYRVNPKYEDEAYDIISDPAERDVGVRIRDGMPWIEVTMRGGGTRQLAAVLGRVAGLDVSPALPITAQQLEGPAYSWDKDTVFMLGLLSHEFSTASVSILNLDVARFESDSAEDAAANPMQPTVRSVRLQGRHLMSSRQACEMIVAGRALRNLHLRIAVSLTANDQVLCPIRIELANDHASLFTGFTEAPEPLTRQVHAQLLTALRGALDRGGLANGNAVRALARQIDDRATEGDPDKADILAPPADEAAEDVSEAA